jgi:hypothetical protein
VPTLTVTGCPTAGQQLSAAIGGGPNGSFAVLGLGLGRAAWELAPTGCALRLGTVLATSPILALPAGAASYTIAIPPTAGIADYTLQAFCLDGSAALGLTGSAGVEIRIR